VKFNFTTSEQVLIMQIDESKLIQTIIVGSDWQEVLSTIVIEEGLNPENLDISKLAELFMVYLQRLKEFDFRIPARFILIASILLRMKCEILLEEQEEKEIKTEEIPQLNLEDVPELLKPIERRPTRKVTLNELVTALNKAFDFKERKESKKLRMRRAVETLIEPEEDIEVKIESVMKTILSHGTFMKFSDIVPVWEKKEIVEIFLPLLYLSTRGKIEMTQEEFFKEIFLHVK
jgi:segregation and condensation protein A